MAYVDTLLFAGTNNVGYVEFFRIMSNTDNVENRIQIHQFDIHIKKEYEYEFHIWVFNEYR
jgi:hypothetical protein